MMSQNAKVAQLVEHDLAKVGVASSNLVFRSRHFQYQEDVYKINPVNVTVIRLRWWNW